MGTKEEKRTNMKSKHSFKKVIEEKREKEGERKKERKKERRPPY